MGLCHSSKNQHMYELCCKYDQTVKAASFKMNTFLKEFFTITIELSYPSPSQMLRLKAHFHNSPHLSMHAKTISMKLHYWTVLQLKVMSSIYCRQKKRLQKVRKTNNIE